MSLSITIQALISGVTNGFVYALMGLGMAVIFKGTRIINVMQGEFAVIGAMVTVLGLQAAAMPYPIAIVFGTLCGAALGVLVDTLCIQPMTRRRAGEDSFLLLTIGLAVLLSAAVLFFGGRDSRQLPFLGGDGVVEIFGAVMLEHALWLVCCSSFAVLALRLFYSKTLVGLAMTAAANDPDGAATNGINVQLMRKLTFLIGGGVGAFGGILLTPLYGINYQVGLAMTLKGFAAAILGGIANPMGAIIGGVTLGLLESLAVVWFPSGYKDVVALGILILIIVIFPHGILGRAGRRA